MILAMGQAEALKPSQAHLFEIYELVRPNIPDIGSLHLEGITVEKLVIHSLLNPSDESSEFIKMIEAHVNPEVSDLPTKFRARMLVEPEKYYKDSRDPDIGTALELVRERMMVNTKEGRRSYDSLFDDFIWTLADSRIYSDPVYLNLIEIMPLEEKRLAFEHNLGYASSDTEIALFKKLFDIKTFKDKKTAQIEIDRIKKSLAFHLAGRGHKASIELISELEYPDYIEVAKQAHMFKKNEIAQEARQLALKKAFRKTYFFQEPPIKEMTAAVMTCMEQKDWESLESELKEDKGFLEVYKWLKSLPIILTESVDLYTQNKTAMTNALETIFFRDYSPKDTELILKNITFNLIKNINNTLSTGAIENLLLLYPETKEAQGILLKREFSKALETGNLNQAQSLIISMSPQEQASARTTLASYRLKSL